MTIAVAVAIPAPQLYGAPVLGYSGGYGQYPGAYPISPVYPGSPIVVPGGYVPGYGPGYGEGYGEHYGGHHHHHHGHYYWSVIIDITMKNE